MVFVNKVSILLLTLPIVPAILGTSSYICAHLRPYFPIIHSYVKIILNFCKFKCWIFLFFLEFGDIRWSNCSCVLGDNSYPFLKSVPGSRDWSTRGPCSDSAGLVRTVSGKLGGLAALNLSIQDSQQFWQAIVYVYVQCVCCVHTCICSKYVHITYDC